MARTKASTSTPKTPKESPTKQGLYSVVVRVAGVDYPAEGRTIREAILGLNIPKFGGKVEVKVSNGKLSHDFEYVRPWLFQKALVSEEYMGLLEKRALQFLGEIT